MNLTHHKPRHESEGTMFDRTISSLLSISGLHCLAHVFLLFVFYTLQLARGRGRLGEGAFVLSLSSLCSSRGLSWALHVIPSVGTLLDITPATGPPPRCVCASTPFRLAGARR
eukprot:155681-Pelagomonas_calceolata.AAC.1